MKCARAAFRKSTAKSKNDFHKLFVSGRRNAVLELFKIFLPIILTYTNHLGSMKFISSTITKSTRKGSNIIIHLCRRHQVLVRLRKVSLSCKSSSGWTNFKASEVTYEKTPKYMVIPEVPERIYSMNSTIKLIAIVCNPGKALHLSSLQPTEHYLIELSSE